MKTAVIALMVLFVFLAVIIGGIVGIAIKSIKEGFQEAEDKTDEPIQPMHFEPGGMYMG